MHRYLIFFRQWRYLFLLAALMALLIVGPVATSLVALEATFDLLLVVVFLVLAFGLVQDRAWRIVAGVLCVPAAALSVGGHLMAASQQRLSMSIGHALAALFFLLIVGMILATILKAQERTLDSVFGAICGYLLIGVAWSMTYVIVHNADPESFQISDAVRQQMVDDQAVRNVFIYYSFVTLSTVGYGDLTPRSDAARTLSWLEAVIGQIYLAVVIAGLVSAVVAAKSGSSHERSTNGM